MAKAAKTMAAAKITNRPPRFAVSKIRPSSKLMSGGDPLDKGRRRFGRGRGSPVPEICAAS
ncbi:MAG TPA: hypothetical protein VMC05_00320, partial [Xanthobacteraceae bacterium]|nr:hypothetical protein [Xanthobacteraceae bacterium]